MVLLDWFALQKYDNNSSLTTASGKNIDLQRLSSVYTLNNQRITFSIRQKKVDDMGDKMGAKCHFRALGRAILSGNSTRK